MNRSVAFHHSTLQPHLALIAVQLMFGTWPIVGKFALRVLPSTGLVALRIAGAALAFVLLRRFIRFRPIQSAGDYARLALYSLIGVVLNQFLFVKGLELSTVVNATLLGTAIPVFVILISILLGTERASLRTGLGTLLAAAGVIYLMDPWQADFSSTTTLGNFLLLLNTLCYGAYIVISQEMMKRYGALTSLSWIFIFGCLGVVPIGSFHLAQTDLTQVGSAGWAAVLYIILIPTVGAYYLNAWALARVQPSIVAVYIYLQPLIAFALAPLVLGDEERWNRRTLIAAVLIFAGVAVTTWRSRSQPLADISERPEALSH